MANVITMPDGRNSIIFDLRDLTDLMEEYMGSEAKDWLLDYLADTYGTEDEINSIMEESDRQLKEQKERYRDVMAELRAEAEKLAGLICEKDLDRGAISNTAGRIGSITWREVCRR